MNRESQKNSDTLWSMGGNTLNCILTCLYCTKYNEFNMHHSDVQKANFT